jgi:hypothetical protein
MALRYASGEDIMAGDRVRYFGEPGEVEFVIELGAAEPQTNWYLETQGPGAMILEPKVFGRVYLTDTAADEKLVLVARRDASPRTS